METTYTNAASTSQPKQKYSKRVIAAVIALIAALLLMLVLIPTTAHAADVTVNSNEELVAAVNAAQSGDTITLGTGKYTLYNMGAQTKGKDLIFVGAGADSTEWGIGATIPDPSKFGTEYNGDYSFDGAGTITFKNMTLQSSTADYLGFIRADKTVVDNCAINGKTFYWGYTSAEFTNTTFNAPNYDYALWTYSSPTMTFDGCTFNTTGKCINVYRDYAGSAYTINFKNCTVNNESSGNWKEMLQGTKQVLNINDSAPAGQSYTINISGSNTLGGGKKLDVCSIACSRLFGFAGKSSNNAGNTSNTNKSAKSTSKKKSLPQTGDTFPVAIVIGLVAAGVIAIVASIVASKHSKRSH